MGPGLCPPGRARDADVLTGTLGPQLLAAGAPPSLRPAADPVDDTGRIVREPAFTLLLLQTLTQAVALPVTQPEGEGAETAPVSLHEATRQVLKKAWQRARADALQFEPGPDELRHRARKRLKRLRYALEFVTPALPRKPLRAQLRALGTTLDALGRFNDLQVADAHFRQQTESEPAAWFALGWLSAQRGPALQEALRSLKRLDKAPKAWRRDEKR